MRVTTRMLSDSGLRNLQSNYAALAKVQEQVSSGRRLNRPSDDPAETRTAVKVRESLAALDQHLRNIDVADRTTSAAEAALASAGDAIARVKELALQAANGTVGPSERQAILDEVTLLGDQLVTLANAKSGEDYIFSGQRTKTPAYASVAAAYAGDTNAINARIAPGVSIATNVTADVVFGSSLAAVGQLMADLGAGNPPTAATLTAIDTGTDDLLMGRTRIGAIQNRLTNTRSFVEDGEFAATKLLSDLEDADMAEVISEAATRQTVYEAALKVNAAMLRRSLVDEL